MSQAQTPVGSIQGGVALSRVKANPDDDDNDDSDSTFDAGFFSGVTALVIFHVNKLLQLS